MKAKIYVLLGVFFTLFFSCLAQPQPVKWLVTTNKATFSSNEQIRVSFTGTIEQGWKVYALDSPAGKPLQVRFSDLPTGMTQQKLNQYDVHEGYDPNFNTTVRYFKDLANLDTNISFDNEKISGSQILEGKLTYMTCNEVMCLPPKNIPFKLAVEVESESDTATDKSEATNVQVGDNKKQTLDELIVPKQEGDGINTNSKPTIKWDLNLANETVAPGGIVEVNLTATLGEEWKMYAPDSPAGKPLKIILDESPFTAVGAVSYASAKEMFDDNFKSNVKVFESVASLVARFKVAKEGVENEERLQGKIDFMVCNADRCIPLKHDFSMPVSINLIDSSTVISEEGNTSLLSISDESPQKTKTMGFWAFLLLAMGAGFAALLTPCVFPMIPLTVSYFTKQSSTSRDSLFKALVYGLSIVVTFTGLGVLMAMLVGASGAQTIASNPWVNLFIGVVFVVFALSLLGLFELQLPHKWVNYFNKKGNESKGYLGIWFMGFTLTLVSFSCTVPFVGGLLAATVSDEWSRPILGMIAFSATFALPFVLFALFPKWLAALPKSGSWMNVVKVTLGFIELAAAFKFLSNADLVWGWGILSRPLVIAFMIVIFGLAGIYLLGKLQLPHESKIEQIGVPRLVVAILFFGLSFYMLPGLFGASLQSIDAYLPPKQATDFQIVSSSNKKETLKPSTSEEGWISSQFMAESEARENAFALAQDVGKPIFIDFTGYTCTNCRYMETNVFPLNEVEKRLSERFVLLKLFTDDLNEGEALQAYQFELTGTVALPTYAILTPEGELIEQWQGMASSGQINDFIAFLDLGVAGFESNKLALSSQ